MGATIHCPSCGTAQITTAPVGGFTTCFRCGTGMTVRRPRSTSGPGLGQLLIGAVGAAAVGYGVTQAWRHLTSPRVFISHAWTYNEDYYRLVGLLDADPEFEWINNSVPEHDPLEGGTARELHGQLAAQVTRSNVMLVISGMYVNHREWIQAELGICIPEDMTSGIKF